MKKTYTELKKEWNLKYTFQQTIVATERSVSVDVGKAREQLNGLKPRAKEKLWKEFLQGKQIYSRLSNYAIYRAIKN